MSYHIFNKLVWIERGSLPELNPGKEALKPILDCNRQGCRIISGYRNFRTGCGGQGLKLVSDNGCPPSSSSFLKVTATLDIDQIFTRYNNPKGNADQETEIINSDFTIREPTLIRMDLW